MKLHELFEAYDSEIELQWTPIANGEAAGFKINEIPYVIQIFQSKKIGDVRTNEVSFYRVDASTSDESFSTFSKATAPTAVYGVVLNGIVKYLKTHLAIRNLYFSAERRHSSTDAEYETKTNLYRQAALLISKKLGWERYESDSEFLLTAEHLGTAIGKFEHWQHRIAEMLGDPLNFPTLRKSNV